MCAWSILAVISRLYLDIIDPVGLWPVKLVLTKQSSHTSNIVMLTWKIIRVHSRDGMALRPEVIFIMVCRRDFQQACMMCMQEVAGSSRRILGRNLHCHFTGS